ncbi:MAG: hypothetical protein IM319_08045 [Microcystis sp. M113S1]|uniref:Uncharacterized protein n=1 Tax=Microcystis aeruginosa TAIHU98 TaxID=1134457 RepID=L7E360_MICAE|nr:hypothetical protein [Microcystis aeruginosa]ELP53895.1 hypothetical protein O53_2706 [Microcystis aeruginosa TAIHU98]MCA2939109.1 hypothetical protein [Microcystis sp. M113S1]CCI33534.1 hypothetical protein MICAI_370005 [Microcystis sp. T1-4]
MHNTNRRTKELLQNSPEILEIDLAILGKKLTKELGIGASLLGIIINK